LVSYLVWYLVTVTTLTLGLVVVCALVVVVAGVGVIGAGVVAAVVGAAGVELAGAAPLESARACEVLSAVVVVPEAALDELPGG
jgi:hypothetical protein